MTPEERAAKIRELNDQLRTTGRGRNTKIVAVGAFGQAGRGVQMQVVHAVSQFNDFPKGDDPYGEHDFGKLTVGGRDYIWKIDYYALDEEHGSEHPEDPNVTIRILSIFHAEDY